MAVPKLRFKEFDGRWKNTSFQSLFTFKNGINASKEQYGSGTKFINVLDIINNPNGITYDSIIGSVQVFQKDIDKNLVNYGDVVFQRSSETREEVGQSNVYLSKEPVVFGGFVIRGFARVSYDPLFMNGLLKTDKVRDQITQLSGGSTRFNIGQDSLNKVSVFLPLKEEQTKIASFLSAVDEKISQLTQKHELLSQYKQGMMQKLFSQQIRFKADDGSEFGEWEEKILKDLFPKIRNGFVGVATPYYVDYGVKYLQGKNIKNGKIDDKGLIYINQEFHQKKTNSILKTNDILMVQSGHVGECSVVTEDYDNANCHALLVLSPKSSKLIKSKFVVYYFYSEIGKKKITLIKTGNTIEHILASDIKEVSLLFPCIEEQTKIANFLSSIDQKIEVVAQQIEQAKQWKKGLLQQMFV